jgi:hypothetical protein
MNKLPEKPDDDKEVDADEEMKPPEEMSEEELRLMADTMPGDGPGGD